MNPTIAERRKEMNEGLAQDIKEIKNMLADMKQAEAARGEREKTTHNDVEGLKKTINGNGVPGLKTDVQIMKEQMGRINWIMGIFVAAVIADIVTRIMK
jgi:hypothetical protein